MNVRYLGVTDEITTCEHCGRSGLKKTVIIQFADADGNGDGEAFYGTDCAARALGRSAGSIAQAARAAQMARDEALSLARTRMAGIDVAARPGAITKAYLAKYADSFQRIYRDDSERWFAAFATVKHHLAVLETNGLAAL